MVLLWLCCCDLLWALGKGGGQGEDSPEGVRFGGDIVGLDVGIASGHPGSLGV